jgi:hypothetical protein
VSYECSSNPGLPANGFDVGISVTVASNKGCDTVGTGTVKLTPTPLPQLTVEKVPVASFCAVDGSVDVSFTVTSPEVPYDPTGDSWSLVHTVLGGSGSVTCDPKSVTPGANSEWSK